MFSSSDRREGHEIINNGEHLRVPDTRSSLPSTTTVGLFEHPYHVFPLCGQVDSSHLDKFHAAYGALLKSSMTTLRKRDKKREKERAEKAARRKRRLNEPIVIEGAKRGNGRRIRQRKIKAALKQQEQLKRAKERQEAKEKGEIT
jgi:hypothetical protein